MNGPRTIWISMRAADAMKFFERVPDDAQQAQGRDGAFEVELDAESNFVGEPPIRIVFNNDDMERPEMTGRTIVDWEM